MNVNIGKCFPKTPLDILEKDKEKFVAFIKSKKSEHTKKNVSQNLHYFFNYIKTTYPKIQSVLNITPEQYKNYFNHVNDRKLRKNVKSKYRTNLRAFIYYLLGDILAYNEKLPFNYQYIFSNKFIKFTDTTGEIERDALSITDVFEMLAFFQNRNFRDYVMVELLAYTGMRVGGLVSLQY